MRRRTGRWSRSGLVAGLLLAGPAWAQPPAPVVVGGADGAPVAVRMPDLPAPGEVVGDAEVQRRLRAVEAEIEMLGGAEAAADGGPLHPGWPDLRALAELPPIRTVAHPRNQSVPVLTATLRHTTIQLASDESIVDFVVGDSVYFDVRGADNVAFVKAMALGRRTRVSLVTASSRTYSFDVFATEAYRPDEVLVVEWWAGAGEGEDGASGLVPGFDPDGLVLDFAPAGAVAGYEARIRAAEQDVRRIGAEAAREEIRIRELGAARFGEYLRAYPRRVQMRYRLSEEARGAPLLLTQIWTDGQFTYLRSRSEESPALYSLTGNEGEEPVFVNYTLSPAGLYVVDHVLGAGFAQLQGARGEWHLWEVPPLSLLAEVPLPRGGDGPGVGRDALVAAVRAAAGQAAGVARSGRRRGGRHMEGAALRRRRRERPVARSTTIGTVRGSRGLAPAFVLLVWGVAAAQPPGGTVDTVPAVSIPALPEALRAPAARERAEPFVGPVLQDPAGPAPDAAVLATDAAVEQDPEAPVAGTAEPAAPVEEALPAAPAAGPPAASPPVMGAESDLSLAAQAASLLGGTLDPAASAGGRVALAGGAADLAQSLARAVFAAPVAGSIPYVVQAQVHHDVTLIFPADWSLVQVFVGDPRRWAVSQAGPLVVLKPGEAGARTNLTAVLASGEVLQMDLEEITGLAGARRIGRVYVGPEAWLVDRIFSMLPQDVRRRVVDAPVSVAQLLADPVAVVGLYGGTGAVPSPAGLRPLPAASAAPAFEPVSEAVSGSAGGAEPVAGTAPPGSALRVEAREPLGSGRGPAGAEATGLAEYVSGPELAALESRLRDARARVDTARRSAGDRIAAAQLALEADLAALREEYPLRTQFSYVLDPPLPPYTEPLWHFGVWHDGDRTYWRLLAPDPVFRDADTGEPLAAERIDDFLYRFDRVVERGVVMVRLDNDPQVRELYFRRRRELEGP